MVSPILPLRVEALELRRQGQRILGPVDYVLEGEGITIVLGPNGAGKTSFLRAMHGLERVSRGELHWSAPVEDVRARQAFVFQNPTLLRRTVAENIGFPLWLDGRPTAAAKDDVTRMAQAVGLEKKLDLPAKVLSGGERQKMALARALIREPDLLFLDEPCANLDGASTREIETILLEARARGTRIVMSTHNVGQARRLADDVLFLHKGLLHDRGPGARFFDAPTTAEARAHLCGDLLP